MSYYQKAIIECCGCTAEEAPKVEQLMRDTYRTLDGLSKAAFKKEAKLCLKALRSDPELSRLMDRPKVMAAPVPKDPKAEVVAEFLASRERYEAAEKALNTLFMDPAYAASKAGDVETCTRLMQECPESVTKVFLMDALRQAKRVAEGLPYGG